MKIINKLALTFDDVLLIPQKSEVIPRDVKTRTALNKNLILNIPFISSDMDTVTESKMAIALARLGGLGIIHKNLDPEIQANEIKKVKRSESGLINDPITLSPDKTVGQAYQIMKKENISGIPVVENGKLIGILTKRDLRFETNLNRPIKLLMTKKVITAPIGTSLEKAKKILHRYRIEKLPLVDKQKNLKGLITYKDIQKVIDYPLATKDKKGRLKVGCSVGVKEEAEIRTEKAIKAEVDLIVISTAHGHTKTVLETVKKIRQKYPQLIIIAGNVASPEGVRDLIKSGANIIKVGIGPGSICTTRAVTGAGMPQITAIIECAKEAKKLGKTIIADGGIRYSGDITKALAAGANAVMIGNLFAGTEEAPGELIYYQGKAYKSYRGMGSLGALKIGSKERYNQENISPDKLVPEGVEGRVIYRGPLEKVVEQLIGGLKSGMGLCGAKDIQSLQKKAKFILLSKAGLEESHPHNIVITKEAPNYPGKYK